MNPFPPINLLGDFAGGSMVAVLGILLALFERTLSGKGQVVEASIVSFPSYYFRHNVDVMALVFVMCEHKGHCSYLRFFVLFIAFFCTEEILFKLTLSLM